jgi:hypothetical protein
MQVRKVVIGSVMMGAIAASGLGLAGTASADYKKPTVTYSWQSNKTKTTTVSNSGQLGNGNTQQSASGNAGAISNPQVGFGTNVGLQLPVSLTGANVATGTRSDADGGSQYAKQYQSATGNVSNNSTSVNTSAENGNFSSVSIGNH